MPNEIYHRSNFGNPNAEGFGDVYYDHAATNKLYNHSDYYENSDGTDATLKDLNNKASIVLTPTAYSDGSLNTVIPPYQVLPTELVTNGTFDTDSDWLKFNGATISNGVAELDDVSGSVIQQGITTEVGKRYNIKANITGLGNDYYLCVGTGVGTGLSNRDVLHSQSLSATFVATSTLSYIGVRNNANNNTYTIDNVSVKEIQEADFDFSRGSSATRVNEQGLVEDVQILSGELVQNGDFEQISSELVPSIATIVNDSGGTITQINGNSYTSTSDGTSASSIKPKIDFATTNGKLYKLVITPIGTVTGTVNFDFSDGSTYLFQNYDFTTTKEVYFKDNGGVFGAFDGTQTYSVSNFTISVKEVGQNWSFGTGWSIGDGVASRTAQSSSSLLNASSTTLTVGKTYKCTMTVSNYSDGLVRFATDNVGFTTYTSNGTFVEYLVATGTAFNIKGNSDFTGSVDNISVIEVTDDTDLPRIDFTDGTGSLLLEPQRTNSITYSEDFSDSSWTKSNSSVSSNQATSPDGSLNAYKFIENNVNTYHRVANTLTITNGVTYSTSIFVKKSERKYVRFASAYGSGDALSDFDLENGVVLSGNGDIENYGNGWFRISNTFTADATFTSINAFQLFLLNDNQTRDYLGDGQSGVYIWGAQFEDNAGYVSSYIPTSGSSVTRSADVANNSGNADLFNDSEGVLYAEINALADDSIYRFISISDGTSSNRVFIGYRNTSNSIYILAGTATAFIPHNITDVTKIAIKYKSGDTSVFIDGFEVISKTDTYTLSGLNELAFDSGTGSPFYGNVKCVAVFKEALSNDLLERLTGEGYESFRLLAEANNYTII